MMSNPHLLAGWGGCLAALLIPGWSADQPDLVRVELVEGVSRSMAAGTPEREDATLELLWEAPSAGEVLDGTRWARRIEVAVQHGEVLRPAELLGSENVTIEPGPDATPGTLR